MVRFTNILVYFSTLTYLFLLSWSYLLRFHPVFSKEAGMPLNYQRYCILQDGSPIDPQQYSALLADDSESLMSTTSDRF